MRLIKNNKACIIFLILSILILSGCLPKGCGKRKQTPEYMRENLAPLFEKYNVDIVFSGNDHNYQRSFPMKAGKIDHENGVIYIVDGSGGSQLRDFDRIFWQARATKQYMFIHATIKGDKAEFRAINRDNRVIDRFDIDKSDKP